MTFVCHIVLKNDQLPIFSNRRQAASPLRAMPMPRTVVGAAASHGARRCGRRCGAVGRSVAARGAAPEQHVHHLDLSDGAGCVFAVAVEQSHPLLAEHAASAHSAVDLDRAVRLDWSASSSRCRRCLWRSSWPCRLRLRVRLLEPTLSHAAKPARRRHGLLIRREQSKQLEFLARREQRALFDRPHRSRRAARSAEGSHWPNFGK